MANKLEDILKKRITSLSTSEGVINLSIPLIVKDRGKEKSITRLEKKGKCWKAISNDTSYTISTFPRCVQLQLYFLLGNLFKREAWGQTMIYEIRKLFVVLR